MQFTETKSLEVILNEIVARVRQFTSADGAAIAMRDGDFVVTRATTGGTAPDLGARMSIQGSFTGLCLEKRTVLHCEDSDNDGRVDPKVCRQLNTRSFVVVPIGDKLPQGVLAAFSSNAHAFTRTDIAVLKTAADQIIRALTNPHAETTPESSGSVEPKVEKQKDEAPKQLQPVVIKNEPPTQVQTAAIMPAVAKAATAAADPLPVRDAVPARAPEQRSVAAIPARVTVPSNVVPITKSQEPETLVSLAESIGTPARTEAPSRKLEESREQQPEWKGFEGHEDSPRSAVKWFLLAAVVCAVLVGGLSYLMRRPLTLRDNAAAKFNNSDVRATESSTQAVAESARVAPAPAAFAATKTSTLDPTATTPPVTKDTKEKNAAVVKQTAMVIDSSSSVKPRAPEVPDAEAPRISISSSNAAPLPETKPAMPGAPKPPPPVRQSDFQPSELISKVMPQFPRTTTAPAGVQTVVLHAQVLADGTVGDVRAIQGRAEFAESAKAAVKQWRYKPAHMDGKAVESSINVTLNFKR